MSEYQKGILITFFGVLFVTPDSLFVRLISSYELTIAFWRSFAAGLLILTALITFAGLKNIKSLFLMGKLGWLYCFLIGSTSPAFVCAVENTSVANVVFIFAAMPIFAALFSYFLLGEPIATRVKKTIVTVSFGLVLIAYGSTDNEISNWKGDLFALYVCIAYAAALTLIRKLQNISVLPALPVAYLSSALILFFFTDPFIGFEANANFYLLHGILIAAGTCFLAIGPRYISSPEASLLILLETILAPLLVWAVLYEYPGNWSLLGGALIVLTLLVFNFSAFSKTKQAAYKETP